MSLSKRYRELMDQANQAKDRQTYFYYVKKAELLLRSESPDHYGISGAFSPVPERMDISAA